MKPPLYAIAILIYTAICSFELLVAWRTAPYEQYGWITFLIWTSPIIYYWTSPTEDKICSPLLLWFALMVTTLGVLGSINTLKYIGFAIALASFVPPTWVIIPWLISSLAWMPATGWLISHTFTSFHILPRALLAGIGAIIVIINRRRALV